MSANRAYNQFVHAVERFTGRTIDEIRHTPICTSREDQEKEHGKYQVTSFFPLIGRGNILRDRTLSRREIEERFDDSLDK